MNTAQIELYFPDPVLSPNAKNKSWYYKEDARKFAKEYAFSRAKETGIEYSKGNYQATITFFPPNKKRRDLDNLLSSLKPDMDGICRGLGIDDSQIRRVILEWGEVISDGKVIVKIEPL